MIAIVRKSISLVLALCVGGALSAQEHEVIGYFPSWKRAPSGGPLSWADLPFEKLTIINYAFFIPLPDGSIVGKDSVGDAAALYGHPDSTLVGLAHRRGVKVMLSLGGWSDSEHFPAIAADPGRRAAFAHSCLEAVRAYRFDGIDIDWEYPGYADHKGTPADRENFTLLLKTLRDSLRVQEAHSGTRLLLTAALPAGATTLAGIDVAKVAGILDLLNLMTYDFHGPWDPLANHNSPLYASAGADSLRSVDAAVALYRDVHGIESSKINIGVPFYGHTYTECRALNSRHAGADTTHFSPSGAFYADIVRILGTCTPFWDERAQVPYLVNEAWGVLISYDDEESVRAKARYVLDHKLRGLIIWEITGDRLPDGRRPLLEAIHTTLHPPKNTGH